MCREVSWDLITDVESTWNMRNPRITKDLDWKDILNWIEKLFNSKIIFQKAFVMLCWENRETNKERSRIYILMEEIDMEKFIILQGREKQLPCWQYKLWAKGGLRTASVPQSWPCLEASVWQPLAPTISAFTSEVNILVFVVPDKKNPLTQRFTNFLGS